ncbi:MAG: hypothetical protein GEU95_07980 [Rhizobiales bacterium]|nr:hypothetical protein [Hyphomicrobiales bacterium]
MVRPLHEYGWDDWRRLRPVSHGIKTLRYDATREIHVRRRQRGGDTSLPRRIRGRRVLVTIAYDDSEVIDMQASAVAQFVPHAFYVIADNSSDDTLAREVAAVALRHAVPYVRLPRPLSSGEGSRSHGLALDWTWRNVIRPGAPEAFGFLDDDVFPTAPDDPFATLRQQPVYGALRTQGDRWFLWAGFCFFRFDAVSNRKLNFGQDWFKGLDTGGGNWEVLYRLLDPNSLAFAPTRFEPYRPGADPVHDSVQWCGQWLHEVGQTRRAGRLEQAADKRRRIKKILAPDVAPSAQGGGGGTSRERPQSA